MRTICLYFEIHQIIHLKRYRFFDIGTDHYYYDDYENARSITETAEKSYIPALKTLISMAESNKRFFKCALSLSGCAIEQLESHAPEVLDLIKRLYDTGCCDRIRMVFLRLPMQNVSKKTLNCFATRLIPSSEPLPKFSVTLVLSIQMKSANL